MMNYFGIISTLKQRRFSVKILIFTVFENYMNRSPIYLLKKLLADILY